jgi:NADP-dependent 3-hydroxy acid dehydrogenase YdfG
MENVKNKVVAITGASSGIGEATALLLARYGAKVVIGARRADRLQALAERIMANGGEAAWLETDVTRKNDLCALVQLALDTFGRLDVIINNAGIAHLSRMDEVQVDEWEEMIEINLKGTLYGIAAALPVFSKQGTGHVVNIISTSGIKITPLQGVYAATKNAVRTLTEALRQEAGPNLRVTGISPGFVNTELADHMKDPAIAAAIKERAAKIAISPGDIAAAVLYAISQPVHVDVGDLVIRPTAQN